MRLQLGIVCLLVLVAVITASNGPNPLQVTTYSGIYTGIYKDKTRAFLGVPYALPPVGNLRFRPPQPLHPTEFRSNYATKEPPSCFQAGLSNKYNYSEDCLYMNIYTPRYPRGGEKDPYFQRLPVMVFLHGGRYWTGAAIDFDGSQIAHERDVISVVIQYRLNIFGFQSFDSNTNIGLQDQQAALRWIQKNIRYFGGDPKSVTIYGESAGGSSVLHHLTNKDSYKLYNRAILQSAWQWYIPTATTSREKAIAFAATKGCNITDNGVPNVPAILECMRNLPARNITPTTAQCDFFVPMVDGLFIKKLPLLALKEGLYNKGAEIVIGHNYDEGNFMASSRLGSFVSPSANITHEMLVNSITRYLKFYFAQPDIDTILGWYLPVAQQVGNWYGGAEFFGDYYITCGSILAAEYFNRDLVNFQTYIFNYSSPNYPTRDWYLAASHGNELPYIFYRDVYTPYAFSADDYVMASNMNSAWTTFAANGTLQSSLSKGSFTYPNATYYGPNATDFSAHVPYTKAICEKWGQYFLAY